MIQPPRKPSLFHWLPVFFVLGISLSQAQLTNVLTETETGWAYLHPTDGMDPAASGSDADFQATWFHQNLGSYTGGSYDGPAFTTGATAPLHYGGVDGLSAGTTLATPASGDRYTSYFLKVVDGGANGYHALEIDLLGDDGAFVYLNGVRIAEDNIAGADTYTGFTTAGGSETSYDALSLIGAPTLNPGPNLVAVSNHNTSATSSDLGFAIRMRGIDASIPLPTTIISETATNWAYLHPTTGVDPDTTDADFDTTWSDQSFGTYTGSATYDGPAFTTGATAPFAYGGVTGITPGTTLTTPASGSRYTAYFLYEIDGGATGYSNLDLTLLADDGAFVYLNGNLIATKNLGAATADTWELHTGGTGSETDFSIIPFTGTTEPLVKPGPNLLALSLHQTNATSSDLGFKLRLTGDAGLPDIGAVYPRNVTYNSADLTWCTGTAGDSTVKYDTVPSPLTLSANVSGSFTEHSVPLAGLAQNTTYYFEVVTTDGSSFTASETGSFTTAPDPNAINLSRGPYLQSASHDRMTVCWRTTNPGNSKVHYGTTQGSLTQSVTVPGSETNHEVTLPSLAANTTYYYQVETDNSMGGNFLSSASADHFFTTSPTPGTPTPTRIWVIGDSGTANSDAEDVYNAFRTHNGQDHTDVWLMLGDNAYNDGSDTQYQAAVFDLYPELLRNTPVWPTFGNHESYSGTAPLYDDAPHWDIFQLPTAGECGGVSSGTEHYHSFDYGNIHFICLDSQTGIHYNDTLVDAYGMADWLQSDLEATTADWIIVYYHHGPYTKGSHDSDSESHHIAMRGNTLSILENYGVDLILSGHSHCYERSRLINGHYGLSGTYVAGTHAIDAGNGSEVGSIDGSGNFLLSGADGAYQKPLAAGNLGQVSSIVGSSGKLSNWTQPDPLPSSSAIVHPNPHPVFVANLRVLGSMVVDIDGPTLHAVFLDSAGLIRDDFTILKGSTLAASATDDTMTEGDAGNNTATVTVTRTGAVDLPLTVDYTIAGTAGASDYTPALSGTLSFAIGETSKPITLTIAADDQAEGPETLTLTLVPRTDQITGTSAQRDTYFLDALAGGILNLTDLPSQTWWFTHFGTATVSAALWQLDHDSDGHDALMEYGLNGNPMLDDYATITPTGAINATTLEFHYTRDNSKTDIEYHVKTSGDLGPASWTETGVTDVLDGPANPAGPEDRKASVPHGGLPRFLKLEVSFP